MKTIITISLLFIATLGLSQDQYQLKMSEAMKTYSQVASVADYVAAANKFELIANAKPKEWLPLYYHAQCYIMMSFSDRSANAQKKDTYLEIANQSIDKMIIVAPEESEVYALKALYYTAKLVIDPMSRGQKYGLLINSAIQTALAKDPKNPRAKQLELSNKVGTAEFFGKDISEFKPFAEEIVQTWDDYEIRGPFYPTWGKDRAVELLARCSKEKEVTSTTLPQPTQSINGTILTIEINKLKSDSGRVMLELMDENQKTVLQTMAEVHDGISTIILKNLVPGTYSIKYFHDANANNKMDVNKFGKPIEKYGFSNNARGFMSAPKYKKTLFDFKSSTTIKLKAK